MFKRYNERARRSLILAREEAQALRHNHIGTEHLLLGLLRDDDFAARVLESFGVLIEDARAQVAQLVPQANEVVASEQIPFTPNAKKVLELALREALSLGHNYIGTEHIRLGLVRLNEGVAATILGDFDADTEKIRNEIIRWLSGFDRRQMGGAGPVEGTSTFELGLRRVLPVAQQVSDDTLIVSVEIWDHGLVIRWATSEPHRPDPVGRSEHTALLVSDDVGTSYTRWGGGGGGNPQRGFHHYAEFEPTLPPTATLLRIRREATSDELSISLSD